MDNYLIDRDTLATYVDEIMKQKPAPVNTPEELNELREKNIKELNSRIISAIAHSMSGQQLREITAMLDNDEVSEDDYQEFFDRAGVDIQKVLTDAIAQFGADYLGGNNE